MDANSDRHTGARSLFEPVWETLAPREQARILHLLIEHAPAGTILRISRLMALAIRFDHLIKSGQITYQAYLARSGPSPAPALPRS